jgi:ubiquinone/menaquinone biosynthesis C-methylase UbiE
VTYRWVDCDQSVVAARYDRIAGLIGFIDWLLFVPSDFRQRAAQRLALEPGDRVLEIGCGTGRNFANLRAAVGPRGQVFGVDLSSGMLTRARHLCARQGWTNIELTRGDAATYLVREPVDAVLFGLCYNTMPHHRLVLHQALKQLRPGGRLVIMDGKLPPGPAGQLLLPFSLWLMRATMLGNPLIKPWLDLAAVVDGFGMEQFVFGSWYICWGTKSRQATADDPLAGSGLLTAAE